MTGATVALLALPVAATNAITVQDQCNAEGKGALYKTFTDNRKDDQAKAYDAACTPDFYVFDSQDRLVYRGQMDDSRPGNNIPLSGSDLRTAIDGVLYIRPIPQNQKPSMGCNIKWK